MTSKKVEDIQVWDMLQSVKDVQSFMDFANFYQRFIEDFSKIAKPLTNLTKKSVKWNWTPACNAAFEYLKERFTTGPILTHFDETRLTKL